MLLSYMVVYIRYHLFTELRRHMIKLVLVMMSATMLVYLIRRIISSAITPDEDVVVSAEGLLEFCRKSCRKSQLHLRQCLLLQNLTFHLACVQRSTDGIRAGSEQDQSTTYNCHFVTLKEHWPSSQLLSFQHLGINCVSDFICLFV